MPSVILRCVLSRENMLRVRFSDDEYDRLKSLADEAGILHVAVGS